MNKFKYFAYGSNMLRERLLDRCKSAQFVCTAVARGYALNFGKRSKDCSGKATLFPVVGEMRQGVVFEIDIGEREALDRAEGVGLGYSRIDDFSVLSTADKSELITTTYLADEVNDSLQPFDWYLALVVAGAEQNGLPEQLIESLRQIPFKVDQKMDRSSRTVALSALKRFGVRDLAEYLNR